MSGPVAKGGFSSQPLPEGVRIVIPTARNWFVLVFLPFWLCGWAAGVAALTGKLYAVYEGGGGLDPVMSFWLAGWTVGGLLAWVVFLWFLVGIESIEVSSSALTITQKIGPFVRKREFDLLQVKDLRLSSLHPDGESPLTGFAVRGYGLIAFDHGSRTHRFGGVTHAEDARRICREISRWLPLRASASDDDS